MNVVLYYICLVLLLPICGIAAFGYVIDTIGNRGLWEVIKLVFGPLYDPFGKGIWIIMLFLGILGMGSAGFFPAVRPYGFGAIAAIGILCGIYIARVYPSEDWALGSIVLFIPSLIGVALSIYCVVRPLR